MCPLFRVNLALHFSPSSFPLPLPIAIPIPIPVHILISNIIPYPFPSPYFPHRQREEKCEKE